MICVKSALFCCVWLRNRPALTYVLMRLVPEMTSEALLSGTWERSSGAEKICGFLRVFFAECVKWQALAGGVVPVEALR